MDLPQCLSRFSRHIVNIRNVSDQRCFLYSVLSAVVKPSDFKQQGIQYRKDNPKRYFPFLNRVEMGNLSFPVQPSDMSTFEGLNPNIAINLFGKRICVLFSSLTSYSCFQWLFLLAVRVDTDDQTIIPLYITRELNRKCPVNLLLICNPCLHNNYYHYTHIKDLRKFLHILHKTKSSQQKSKSLICLNCFRQFRGDHPLSLLRHHQPTCLEDQASTSAANITMPAQ